MKKIVVKVGSSVIAPQGRFDSTLISCLVKDILEAEKQGLRVVLVSSGAIACGLGLAGYQRKPNDTSSLMALSSLGQIRLMNIYADKFKQAQRLCAQILLTWDDFDNRKRFINARGTIEKALALSAVPIINENDAVSCEEIRFGDNDSLSALVSDLIGAELLIMLSDVDGLFDGDSLVKTVERIDSRVLALAKKGNKTHTAGGMLSKLEAAKTATAAGVKTVIANGRSKQIISRLSKGERVGTLFLPAQNISQARKRWIAFSKKVKGKIYIDDGAAEALSKRGKSLLAVGIVKIEGSFQEKDSLQIYDLHGNLLGCGLVNYSSQQLTDLKAKKFAKEIVHRDNFVKAV